MQKKDPPLNLFTQNNKLSIRLISPGFGHLPSEITAQYGLTHRKPYYFFLFMLEGHTQHGVDLQQFDIKKNELLFILPHQIHRLPTAGHGTDYFKIGFDENTLPLLPKQFLFLVNPFNNQKIKFDPSATARLKAIFGILTGLLGTMGTEPELILAQLNSLLTEMNIAYFSGEKSPADDKLSKYILFKRLLEDHLTDHLPVNHIAERLGVSTNSLYNMVKHYSGLSPKSFINNRLMLEAKRRLCYSESSIKELAYDLGFSDPEYFARLFKKLTGKTITRFVQDLSGN